VTSTPDAAHDRDADLDVLATEVGLGVEQELEREGLLGKARTSAAAIAHVPVWTKEKVAELVDAGLDRVYAKPLEIDNAAEALAFLTELGEESTGNEPARRMAGIIAAAGPILVRLAKGTGAVAKLAGAGTKVLPTGRMITLGTTAVLATVRIGASARVGARELQILASYLMARMRQAGRPVDRDLIEQVVVQCYLDPDARPQFQAETGHGAGGLARAWAARGIKAPSGAKRAQINRKRVDAIERLDVHALAADWERARAAALPPPDPSALAVTFPG
jgi:hypothetical protein